MAGNKLRQFWDRYWSMRHVVPLPLLILADLVPFVILGIAILFLGAHFLGWSQAFDVFTLNTSPKDSSIKNQAVAWMLWALGWGMVPAFIGAVTGEAVGALVGRREAAEAAKKPSAATVREAAKLAAEEIRKKRGLPTPPPGPHIPDGSLPSQEPDQ
ncbi:DUF6313 family protein [Streptomyces sp. NPDC056361]|uniref:DUF6313 family protein n=1 Tax=Streptomyces sp. NPDC056361 TaxID=3345795 RepID=UPI0035DBEBE5